MRRQLGQGIGRAVAVLSLVLICGGAQSALAQYEPRIVNGALTSAFPTTGALLRGTSALTATTWCSGTLIGCETFLTAAHCVEDDPSPAGYQVFLQHAGVFSVTSIEIHPSYDFPVADVAVLKLGTQVTGIHPSPINTIQDPPFGSVGMIAGFGRSGGSNQDYGLKRYGQVTTSSCAAAGESNATSVCWQFDAPIGDPGSSANTCNADSGGPLFLSLGGSTVVAGITSGGVVDSCLTGDVSYDADVYNYRSFIQAKAGSDLNNASCGAVSHVGDDGVVVEELSGSVNSVSPQALHSFVVEAGTDELRVALNAIDNGSADFDLYVKRGSAPTTTAYDCARTGANQFGVCTFSSPTADTWYAMVRRYAGSGTYQLTVTRLGESCSDPANEGAACNDVNPCTSDDTCTAGTCQGALSAEGSECGAGTLCSGPAICQSGVCKTSPTPATVCKEVVATGGASLQIKDAANGNGDKIQWRWRGEETLTFGNPAAGTSYAFCVFDEVGGAARLIVDQAVPPGAMWTPLYSGYNYRDSTAANSGVRAIKLRYGADKRASVSVLSRGTNVDIPSLPLAQDSQVLVQLVTDTGLCWEGRYGSSRINSDVQFKALSD